jgi:hypothetical protein
MHGASHIAYVYVFIEVLQYHSNVPLCSYTSIHHSAELMKQILWGYHMFDIGSSMFNPHATFNENHVELYMWEIPAR